MNDIFELENLNHLMYCRVYTSNCGNNWFSTSTVKILRIGVNFFKNAIYRYYQYIRYNLGVSIGLLLFKPEIIICYETYSVLPAYLYAKMYKQVRIHIHYHEYLSQLELDKSSLYFKLLHFYEKKLWLLSDVTISHTNDDRKNLFLQDYLHLNANKISVYPNLPPKDWKERTLKSPAYTNKRQSDKIRLVHVGALGIESMYVKELVEWVINKMGAYELDFYILNISVLTDTYLNDKCKEYPFIRRYPTVSYYNLPDILGRYDIGVVLYKSLTPNYTFNVPNKVLEYLYCGLNVCYSHKLISTAKYVEGNHLQKICRPVDFENINKEDAQFIPCDDISSISNIVTPETKIERLVK
ncbi:MAG: hypothetical protein IT263_12815 [Saprospiraceae bacterium]|nr:hypothetical protein [Saprospiraceae bacterium]